MQGSLGDDRLVALFLFPKLALGLSGFETGVVVMPLVKGDPGDTPENPQGRIRNTRKLLLGAAAHHERACSSRAASSRRCSSRPRSSSEATDDGSAGKANGRALAYLAHTYLGDIFGTVYDSEHDPDPLVRRGVGDGRVC